MYTTPFHYTIPARLLSIKDINPADYINELDNFLLDVSVLSFLATLWVAFVFVISRQTDISVDLDTPNLTK